MPPPAWNSPTAPVTGATISSTGWGDLMQDRTDYLKLIPDYLFSLTNAGGGGNVAAGDLAVQDTAADNSVTRTTTQGQAGPILVALAAQNVGAQAVYYRGSGFAFVNVTGSVSRGQLVRASATAGLAEACSDGTAGAFGRAFAASSAGQCFVELLPYKDLPFVSVGTGASRGVAVGTAALATTATDGFLYITSSAGPPTGTPTTATGRVPIHVDTTNGRVYFYVAGGWQYTAFSANGLSTAMCHAYASSTQSLTNGAELTLNLDTTDIDVLNGAAAAGQHFTSAANLTGTVAKSGTTALVGTGTLFTTELSVGQVIDVPGTATERRVVTGITDNTHLTVNTAYANTASGQTATRVNAALVCRAAGKYLLLAASGIAANATGDRYLRIYLNDAVSVMLLNGPAAPGLNTFVPNLAIVSLALWDRVTVAVFQNSGGALNTALSNPGAPSLGMVRLAA